MYEFLITITKYFTNFRGFNEFHQNSLSSKAHNELWRIYI